MRTILSGVKPTGDHTHLGNYFGAIKQFVDLQHATDQKSLYFIANYHALTTEREGNKLAKNSLNILREYMAYGLDPKQSIIFMQSDVPELTELTWIFNCLAPMGLLERAHAYKDALAKGKEANVGLFDYPVLMAADILLYRSTHVPVGKDQKQHVEIARDIAEKFNHYYGETFVLPEPIILDDSATVIGTDGEKMSKSYNNTICPFEDEKVIAKKIMGLKTDSKGVDEPKDTENSIILSYLQLVASPEILHQVRDKFTTGGMGYGDAKKILLQAFMDYFAPMRKRYNEITPDELHATLEQGAAKIGAIASPLLAEVRNKVGLI